MRRVHAFKAVFLAASLVARVAAGCPIGFDPEAHEPQRVVMQHIGLVLHVWREYAVGTEDSPSACIFQEEPVRRLLAAEEAARLIDASRSWQTAVAAETDVEILDPDDPRLAVEPMEIPQFSVPSGGATAQAGDADLTRVVATGEYPWNTIAFLVAKFPNGEVWRGSGFLAGPHVVLTNAHMVFAEQRGGFATQIAISPGQTQREPGGAVERPFGTRLSRSVRTPVEYGNEGNFEADYAAIFVCDPFDIETYLPLSFDEQPARIQTAGFPSQVQDDARTFALWLGEGDVTQIGGRLLYYDVACSSGASGSPVWSFDPADDLRRVVAVHAFSVDSPAPQYRGGPRLVSDNRSTFQDWLARQPGDPGLEDCPPPAPTSTPTDTPPPTPTNAPAESTPTPTLTEAPTTPVLTSCTGDCDGDGAVRINELVVAVKDALNLTLDCGPADADGDGTIRVNELVSAVKACLNGCPA